MNFNYDNNGCVEVFVDGACSNNGQPNARAGIGVWFGDNHPLNVSAPVQGRQTNNVAEIKAVTAAIWKAKSASITELNIFTDSEFLIKCFYKWRFNWERNNWMTYDGQPVKNKTELMEMVAAINSLHHVTLTHIPAHSGIYGNEMADRLARNACF